MQDKLRDIDCIIEVHDGRVGIIAITCILKRSKLYSINIHRLCTLQIPLSGRNPDLRNHVQGVRPHILALNKVDLADLHNKDIISEKLKREEGIADVVYTNCKQNIHHTVKRVVSAMLDVHCALAYVP